MIRALIALLFLATACAHSPPPASSAQLLPSQWLLDEIIPRDVSPALPGKATGILIQKDIAGVCLIDHGHNLSPMPNLTDCYLYGKAEENTYVFARDNQRPYPLYFHSLQGQHPMKAWKMPNGFTADATQFTPSTPNPWGLSRPVQLVELEVNGGLGSPEHTPNFIATSVKVLADLTGPVLQVLSTYAQPGAAFHAAHQELAEAVKRLERADPAYPTVSQNTHGSLDLEYQGFRASWMESRNRLQVIYYQRYREEFRWMVPTDGNDGGQGGYRRPHRQRYTSVAYVAELAHVADFDRDGKPIENRDYPARARKQGLTAY